MAAKPYKEFKKTGLFSYRLSYCNESFGNKNILQYLSYILHMRNWHLGPNISKHHRSRHVWFAFTGHISVAGQIWPRGHAFDTCGLNYAISLHGLKNRASMLATYSDRQNTEMFFHDNQPLSHHHHHHHDRHDDHEGNEGGMSLTFQDPPCDFER